MESARTKYHHNFHKFLIYTCFWMFHLSFISIEIRNSYRAPPIKHYLQSQYFNTTKNEAKRKKHRRKKKLKINRSSGSIQQPSKKRIYMECIAIATEREWERRNWSEGEKRQSKAKEGTYFFEKALHWKICSFLLFFFLSRCYAFFTSSTSISLETLSNSVASMDLDE